MFDLLGRLIARRPRLTVLAWGVLTVTLFALAMTGFGGQGLFERLHSGEPTVPGSESTQARDLIAEHRDSGEQISLVIRGLDTSDPDQVAQAGRAISTMTSQVLVWEEVQSVTTPFVFGPDDPRAAGLTSPEGFLLWAVLVPDLDADAEAAATERLVEVLHELPARIAPQATGIVSTADLITEAIVGQMERDLITGELVALPISLLIMVVVFGGFLTAGMPLAGAIASIAGGLGTLLGFSYLLELDSVVVNVVTVLGLGLSIDYGLLVVSRYREEIHTAAAEPERSVRRRRQHRGGDPVILTATRRTLTTAGRTVAYSALIVAISILGMVFLRPDILKSLGVAGAAVVLVALASALTLVPALLVLMGRRMLKPPLMRRVPGARKVLGALGEVAPADGVFSRLAGGVQRRPWLVLVSAGAVLVFLASPLLSLQLRNSTLEMLPSESDQREFIQILTDDYPLVAAPTMSVLIEGDGSDAVTMAGAVMALDDVVGVQEPRPAGADRLILGVRVDTEDPGGEVASDVVLQIRELRETDPDLPAYWVYGEAPNQLDFSDALIEGIPLAGGVVVVTVLILLFLMTGSVLIPIKALVVNLLSIAASLGITAWIFAEGNFETLLGFTSVGGLESYVVAIAVAFGFGLAMDYEVFLLSRIKEIYDATGDNNHAVKYGLQRSGRIITSAALVIIVVFLGFVAGDLLAIKQAGVALAVIVFIDATLVRMLLVPASMTLLGKYNWWAPAPLRRLHARFDLTH